MYSNLNSYGQSRSAVSTHYPCTSVAIPKITDIDDQKTKDDEKTNESYQDELPYQNNQDGLLPVMDPSFNLREICKQCVLLEDHLTHEDKRCTDCCTKHFLTLEALAEEALTLDKNGKLRDDARQLPKKIRELQMFWINNPDKCHEISQKLREIRKLYQQDTFGVIQNKCSDSSCNIRR